MPSSTNTHGILAGTESRGGEGWPLFRPPAPKTPFIGGNSPSQPSQQSSSQPQCAYLQQKVGKEGSTKSGERSIDEIVATKAQQQMLDSLQTLIKDVHEVKRKLQEQQLHQNEQDEIRGGQQLTAQPTPLSSLPWKKNETLCSYNQRHDDTMATSHDDDEDDDVREAPTPPQHRLSHQRQLQLRKREEKEQPLDVQPCIQKLNERMTRIQSSHGEAECRAQERIRQVEDELRRLREEVASLVRAMEVMRKEQATQTPTKEGSMVKQQTELDRQCHAARGKFLNDVNAKEGGTVRGMDVSMGTHEDGKEQKETDTGNCGDEEDESPDLLAEGASLPKKSQKLMERPLKNEAVEGMEDEERATEAEDEETMTEQDRRGAASLKMDMCMEGETTVVDDPLNKQARDGLPKLQDGSALRQGQIQGQGHRNAQTPPHASLPPPLKPTPSTSRPGSQKISVKSHAKKSATSPTVIRLPPSPPAPTREFRPGTPTHGVEDAVRTSTRNAARFETPSSPGDTLTVEEYLRLRGQGGTIGREGKVATAQFFPRPPAHQQLKGQTVDAQKTHPGEAAGQPPPKRLRTSSRLSRTSRPGPGESHDRDGLGGDGPIAPHSQARGMSARSQNYVFDFTVATDKQKVTAGVISPMPGYKLRERCPRDSARR